MGGIHGRRSSPFPSPTETLSPVTVPQPHHWQPARSSAPPRVVHDQTHAGKSLVDGISGKADNEAKPNARVPHLSRGTSAEQVNGPTPITEDPRSKSERQEDHGRSSQTLRELRRQMEELLVYQQMQQHQQQLSTNADISTSQTNDAPRKRRLSNGSPSFGGPPAIVPPSSASAGSADTVKGGGHSTSSDHALGQTPSYPFPNVQSQSIAKLGHETSERQGQFKLRFPSDRMRSSISMPAHAEEHHTSATKMSDSQPFFLPFQHKDMPEQLEYPIPNLYDLTLKLNANPGLEAWWANLIEILQVHYGAERVSLAVPGDITDLENVPWGQKATFNQNMDTSLHETHVQHLPDGQPLKSPSTRKNSVERVRNMPDMPPSAQPAAAGPVRFPPRPSISTRHSFPGIGTDNKQTPADGNRHRPKYSTAKPRMKHAHVTDSLSEDMTHPNSQSQSATQTESGAPSVNPRVRQAVFPIPRPLEVEADSLIKRTGVVKLFGRANPVVLTRQYSEDGMHFPKHRDGQTQSPRDQVQVTTQSHSHEGPKPEATPASLGFAELVPYDEYEQAPPSPWSQSPAPSPALRTHADQTPFFASHTVDEGAFSQNPPAHDYSTTHPLEAIGVDQAKTVVHLPLLHGGHASYGSSSTLRFPVAVVSLLSTIVPYPAHLRQSLAHLMPHLTTSFCLAQQYSQLERQLMSRVEIPRYGPLLGLGGTFSDASSELELVAGLSVHASYPAAEENPLSARASITSPSDRSSIKFSPALSGFGTPGFDPGLVGLGSTHYSIDSPGLASRLSSDVVDSYFNAQQPKSIRDNVAQHRHRLSKSKPAVASSTPTSPGRLMGKYAASEENALQDLSLAVVSPLQEIRAVPVVSPTQQSSRQGSTNSLVAHLQRESSRPFSDTIAQLMLNSIPLHLFLAKPHSGEAIWTNAKFDAYRRSQPQERKLRDPWQNIHSSERDRVSSKWTNALQTGSQFTERVRVRRSNDETSYRWFIFRANPLLSSTGEVLYWIGSFLDIHEQHIAELKATQEREKFATDAKYRAFSNSIPQVVFEATETGGLIFVNEQWNLYTGQNLEEALNLGFAKHVHPDDLEKCGGLSLKAKQTQNASARAESVKSTVDAARGTSLSESHGVASALDELVRCGVASLQKDENGRVFYSTEIRLRSRGGDFRWHLVRIVCVETSSFGSEEASWYGTCTDINDRKNLERELNKAMHQLNNQMESKTKFFSNMSHEIRTPLNGILGTIPFILDTQLDSDQRRMLDTIQNSSTNLRELVDNILDVSRVEAGKMSLVNSWFHVRSTIEDVIDTIASRAIDKGLEINYLMDADVPAMVIGDRFRIRQVLINLVGNAVKFTAQGEIHIHCSVYREVPAKTKATEMCLNFDVVDTGKGFSSQDAERLMQRFSQLGSNGSQQHAGSGLGLFLSKQLVEMHGGELTPSSKEGQGAKFSFYVTVDAPTPPTPSERPDLLRQSSTGSRRTAMSRTSSYQQTTRLSPDGPDQRLRETFDRSPGPDSPLAQSTLIAGPIAASASSHLLPRSTGSSALPTPEIGSVNLLAPMDQTNVRDSPATSSRHEQQSQLISPGALSLKPPVRLSPPEPHTSTSPRKPLPGPAIVPSEGMFSIAILCPLDNTREATKQHIEQVVPHEIPFNITTLSDVDEWKDLVQRGSKSHCTHLVLNFPMADEVFDVIQSISDSDMNPAPVVVIISDLYQKRQIGARVKEFADSGKRVFMVPKPVKPSAFSSIFDPGSKRELSKDRNQDMAREINNNFKTMSKMVKEVLGNKGYRILLVEDDETNRDVMLKYLHKINLMSETASNGQECTNMVFSKEPGYYSLIICDIQMPVKNGYDTCREIREWEQNNHYPQIPIMALSANAMSEQIENAARAGFNDYVTKPIRHNELGKMMMGLLGPSQSLVLLRDRHREDSKEAPPRR